MAYGVLARGSSCAYYTPKGDVGSSGDPGDGYNDDYKSPRGFQVSGYSSSGKDGLSGRMMVVAAAQCDGRVCPIAAGAPRKVFCQLFIALHVVKKEKNR